MMERQRQRARSAAGRGGTDALRERVQAFAEQAGRQTHFTGYETLEQATEVASVDSSDGKVLAKLVESPFYATGGGQVADHGVVECEHGDCAARVLDVVRVGDDQALVLEAVKGELHPGERVIARVDRTARRPTECNHTATHLLHAALRERLGQHVHQAGSYVGPDKLRFDFTHGAPLTPDELRDVEDRVNEWVLANQPVRALTDDARGGAPARRDGAVRREVRRRRPDGRGRQWGVVARAVRRHARALDRRDRRVQDHHRDLERRQRPAHRGRHRAPRRSGCCAATTAS
jgi:alanyl-tRNA synthetase